MNLTVERYYCHSPLGDGDDRFLVPATVAFCRANNPYFLRRDEWLRVATCASAYLFWPGYVLIAIAALAKAWHRLRVPLLVFIGAKTYAIFYYHFMEFFVSEDPPPNLVPYFAVEGPYVFSIVAVLFRVANAGAPKTKAD